MDMKMKIILAIAPFGIAIAVGTSLAAPAYNDLQDKNTNLDARRHENEELTSKLADRNKVQKQKRELESAIASLRGAVPNKPEMEILNIDLEKMATESGLDLTMVKLADKETIKKAGLDDSEATPGQTMAKGKEALANRVKAAAAPAAGAAAAVAGAAGAAAKAATGAKAKPGVAPDGGLAKTTVQIKLMGSYKNLMTFVHKLETYQRVVAVSELHFSLPKGMAVSATGAMPSATLKKYTLPDDSDLNENDAQGDPEDLNISMLLTAYYLP